MPHDREIAFGAVVPIDADPDWAAFEKLSAEAQMEVGFGRSIAADVIREGENGGHIMRGIVLALAEHFPDEYLERGMASTLRGVRNAFAQIKRERQ